jgi:hypothetical protein
MSPATAFDRATAVTRLDGEEIRAAFDAEISPDWLALNGAHGGYLAALLLRAGRRSNGRRVVRVGAARLDTSPDELVDEVDVEAEVYERSM